MNDPLMDHQSVAVPDKSVSTPDSGAKRSRKRPWIAYILSSLCVPLGVALWNVQRQNRHMNGQLAAARTELSHLEAEQREFKEIWQQREQVRAQLESIYGQWRLAEDIPANPTHLIVHTTTSFQNMNDTTIFSVPAGSHRLEVVITEKDHANRKEIAIHRYEYPLVAPAGYQLTFLPPDYSNLMPEQLRMELTSNSRQFETVNVEILRPFPLPRSSSCTTFGYMTYSYPNEIPRDWPHLRKVNLDDLGIVVNQMTWSPEINKQVVDFEFTVRILSEGPPEIAATSSQVLRNDFELTYLNHGRYRVELRALE